MEVGRLNGDQAATATTARTEEQIVEDLRALAERERLEIDQLEALLTGRRAHLKGLERAMTAISGESPEPRKQRKPHGRASSNDWHISDQKIAEVWNTVRRRGDGFTATSIADETPGLSPESTRRALTILREQEFVRVTGRGRGGGVLMGVMPDAIEREYEPDAAA